MRKLSDTMNTIVQRYLPDPFVFGIALLIIVFISGITLTPSTPMDMFNYFGNGFWKLLSFTMQLAIVLITSAAIANTEIIKNQIPKLARIPKTPFQAVFAVSALTSLIGIINWGLALVMGILFAKEVAKSVKGTHYPLLIASSYIGFTLWSSGISSSIPLVLNTPGNPLEETFGIVPLTETIFATSNIIISIALFFAYSLSAAFMTPDSDKAIQVDPKLLEEETPTTIPVEDMTFADKVDTSRTISSIAGIFCVGFFLVTISKSGLNGLNLNTINLFTLGFGLLMYKGVRSYLAAITGSIKAIAPILILYPFYSAIQVMMGESGLGLQLTNYFASISTSSTLPLFAYLSSGLLNFFVPSAGGQWVIQAPIFLPLAEQFNLPLGYISMAITYGDTWTNLLQPFWALPALALANLTIRDIAGYTMVAMLISGLVTTVLLMVLPLIGLV